jgi:hypothetical protein
MRGEIRKGCHGIASLVGNRCVTNKDCQEDEVLIQRNRSLLVNRRFIPKSKFEGFIGRFKLLIYIYLYIYISQLRLKIL